MPTDEQIGLSTVFHLADDIASGETFYTNLALEIKGAAGTTALAAGDKFTLGLRFENYTHTVAATDGLLQVANGLKTLIDANPRYTNLDVIQDFCSDQAQTRILEIECDYSDDYLAGHAHRVGLAGRNSSSESISRLLPTLRNALTYESEMIRNTKPDDLFHLREATNLSENEAAVARFLGISAGQAKAVMKLDYLFAD